MVFKDKNKAFIILAAAAAVLAGIFIFYKFNNFKYEEEISSLESNFSKIKPHSQTAGWNRFENRNFSFLYPDKLELSQKSGIVSLKHEVAYKNSGDCDMKGDTKTYDNLTDFNASFQIINKNIVDSVKILSPYMPNENFVGKTLKASEGFIDPYSIGNLNGFAIYEGAEGCGHTVYYFPLDDNTKTFVATKNMVQLLSGAISSNVKGELLKVPGVINNQDSKSIFENILKSFKFTDSK
jgi:hypothetical protein